MLSALDADTRDYLRVLVGTAGDALQGQGKPLSADFRRFDPTSRDLLRISQMLSRRHDNIARTIHNFRLLSEAVGSKDQQLAQLVDSSNAVFQAFAHQDANLRATLQLLPPTLTTTSTALGKADRLARVLGPTLQGLRPAARALGPTLRETRPFLSRDDPGHPRSAAALRARRAAGHHPAAPGRPRPRPGHPQPDGHVPDRQLPVQRAGLQPDGARPELPVLAVVGQPHRRLGLRDPGRARPDSATAR